MWNRAMIKGYAKQELKFSYWLSFAVCLVALILGGGAGAGSSNYSSRQVAQTTPDLTQIDPVVIYALIGIFTFAAIISVLYGIFVANPIEVGKSSFFIRAPYGDRKFSNLFSPFSGGRYLATVKTMFVTNLIISLWSLLLIIPGIIKMYQYYMVPYIISENPSLSPKQARELSRSMTDGEKMKIFVLELSFFGWVLLGVLALGVGTLFVIPYIEATKAQLYFILRQNVMGPPKDAPYGSSEPQPFQP